MLPNVPKPELMFLSLSVTTFYRKSFTFESQVSVFKSPLRNPILFLAPTGAQEVTICVRSFVWSKLV